MDHATLRSTVRSLEPEITGIADWLFAHPELSGQEVESSAHLVAYLEAKGFQVQTGVAGLPTAFRAEWTGTGPGPTIAFLAEYDALPSLGHACSHNLIGASACGAAAALVSATGGEFPGKIVVMGTPAEEGPPHGKVAMVNHGIFDDVDTALIIHGGDRTSTGARSLAVVTVEFVFHGRPAHAAKYPERGISALDGAILTMHAIELLREHVTSDVRIHGIITDGGQAPNIVPERAALKYYVRALDSREMRSVLERVITCARAGAMATGAELEVIQHEALDSKVLVAELDQLGLEHMRAAGGTDLLPPEDQVGSTDVGNVSWKTPTSTFKVSLGPGMAVHTREFAEACGGEPGRRALMVGTEALALSAWDLMTDPERLARIKAEHRRLTTSR